MSKWVPCLAAMWSRYEEMAYLRPRSGSDAERMEIPCFATNSGDEREFRGCTACRYEILELKVIHRRRRTGFEETKDFPIRVDDLIAGRYQACSHTSGPPAVEAACAPVSRAPAAAVASNCSSCELIL